MGKEKMEINATISLCFNEAKKFEQIKNYMESTRCEEMSDADVARHLIYFALDNYKFLQKQKK